MPVAIRTATRIQDLDDINVSLGVGVDEYALVYDHDTARFVLRAMAAGVTDHGALTGLSDDDHAGYLLATGTRTGASAAAQPFTLGIVSPFNAPAADSTTAWQVRKADKTTSVLNVDTTNARVGIGTTAPAVKLHIYGGSVDCRIGLDTTVAATAHGGYQIYRGATGALAEIAGYAVSGAANQYAVGSVANDLVVFSNDPAGNYKMMLATGNGPVARLTILGGGNVGIGTIAPATRLDIDAGALTMAEMTAPTGVANKGTYYTRDNGSGKTMFCCKLGDNVEIVLATQA